MAKKIAYAIARESSDDRTLQNQYDSIQKLAKELGYKIVREFGDNISGDASKRDGAFAPFMEELKEAIRERTPDAIFIAALDRLTRTTYEQGYFLTYFSVENRIPMYFAKENVWTIDLATGKLNEKVMSELSSDTTPQKERENIAKRTQAPRAKVGLEGYYIGHLSDGYCVKESWGTY
jgi:DNA invertase Pin-like site-specific DNA recombinase